MNKLEAIDLHKINGHEILEFLNEQLKSNDKLRRRVSLVGPFEFERQEIREGRVSGEEVYVLDFTAYYNNWGTDQPTSNSIRIDSRGVMVLVDEPFEGDGSETLLEDVLAEWLPTHEFVSSEVVWVKWEGMVHFCAEQLGELKYEDTERLDNIIAELKEARSLMK